MRQHRVLIAVASILILGLAAGLAITRAGNPSEPRVKIVGLDHWTQQMVEDSLAHHAPGVSLTSHACAVVLRESLGFAQAAVTLWPSRSLLGGRDLVVVTVVEPQDSARVRFGPAYTDSLPDRADWSDGVALLRSDYGIFQHFQDYDFVRGRTDRSSGREVPPTAIRFRDNVLRYTSDSDLDAALHTLEGDGNIYNRAFAALVLGNFPVRDATWWAYMEALQRPPGHGTPSAEIMLRLLARNAPRAVDWKPVAPTLRALLDGTNLFAYAEVLEALTATRVDPDLGRELLRDGGDVVLGMIATDGHPERRIAREYLTHVAGQDLGADAETWRAWIDGL